MFFSQPVTNWPVFFSLPVSLRLVGCVGRSAVARVCDDGRCFGSREIPCTRLPSRDTSCHPFEGRDTGFVTYIEAAKQGTYDGDRPRNIPRRNNRERLIATLGFKKKETTTLPEKRRVKADVPPKWEIV